MKYHATAIFILCVVAFFGGHVQAEDFEGNEVTWTDTGVIQPGNGLTFGGVAVGGDYSAFTYFDASGDLFFVRNSGGSPWESIMIASGVSGAGDVRFVTGAKWVAVTTAGGDTVAYTTDDNGDTWSTAATVHPTADLPDNLIVASSSVIVYQGGGSLSISLDGGVSWDDNLLDDCQIITGQNLVSVSLSGPSVGIASRTSKPNDWIYYEGQGAACASWEPANPPGTDYLLNTQQTAQGNIKPFGNLGLVLLQTCDSGITCALRVYDLDDATERPTESPFTDITATFPGSSILRLVEGERYWVTTHSGLVSTNNRFITGIETTGLNSFVEDIQGDLDDVGESGCTAIPVGSVIWCIYLDDSDDWRALVSSPIILEEDELLLEAEEFDRGLKSLLLRLGFLTPQSQLWFTIMVTGVFLAGTAGASRFVSSGPWKNYLLMGVGFAVVVFCALLGYIDLWMIIISTMVGAFTIKGGSAFTNTYQEITDRINLSRFAADMEDEPMLGDEGDDSEPEGA